jgi:hypothetical protein
MSTQAIAAIEAPEKIWPTRPQVEISKHDVIDSKLVES